jgi:predicted PhzF superfamily epimerase YddE/YHI9
MGFDFSVVDVFTDRPFGGNGLRCCGRIQGPGEVQVRV